MQLADFTALFLTFKSSFPFPSTRIFYLNVLEGEAYKVTTPFIIGNLKPAAVDQWMLQEHKTNR